MSTINRTIVSNGGSGGLVLSPAIVFALVVGLVQIAVVSANSGSMLTLGKTQTLFAFGDSYSMTNYDPSLGYQPLEQNLTTSSGGNSWIGYLGESPLAQPTLASNTFNFARGGSTLAPNMTFLGYANMSMSNQVDIFEKWFTNNSEAFAADQEKNGGKPEWDADETLFSVWFGINDLELAYKRNETWLDVYGNSTFEFLDEQVGRLYSLGARHFLFHLVPPFQLSPVVSTYRSNETDTTVYNQFKDDVTLWNELMRNYVGRLHDIYDGASAMAWETEEWFEVVLSAPAMFGFTNSTDYCESYVSQAFLVNASPSSPNATDLANCGAPESEYFWVDRSHPTFSVHELLATAVATTLSPGEKVVVPVSVTPLAEAEGEEEPEEPVESQPSSDPASQAVAPTSPDAIVPIVTPDQPVSPTDPTVIPPAPVAPVAPMPIDPSIPSPVSLPVDVNAGVGYTTLPNGDTLPTGTVWTKRDLARRAPGQADMQAAREEAARRAAEKKAAKAASSSSSSRERPSWRTKGGSSAHPAASTSKASSTANFAAPLVRQPGVPIDPNEGVGYLTLPNGDTIPTGKTWTRQKRSPHPAGVEAQQSAQEAAASAASSKKRERQSWKTRTRTAPLATPTMAGSIVQVPAPPPGVPVNPNTGVGFVTLANGDTLPTGTTWTKKKRHLGADVQEGAKHHLERKAHEHAHHAGVKGGMRKITPTMVNREIAKRAEGGGFWEGVKERVKQSVTHPAALGVAV
ncbi:hypothetical protein JCM11251_007977 [Rhodosporidiobolus azoricus]